MADILKQYASTYPNGASVDILLNQLVRDTSSAADAILVLRKFGSVSLAEAKSIVTQHAFWMKEVEAAKPFQEELEKVLSEQQNKNKL